MNELKHTPGPWSVFHPPCNTDDTFGIEASSGYAVVWFGTSRSEGIRRIEDARLIAVAPDLLNVVKKAIAKNQLSGKELHFAQHIIRKVEGIE